ncbi:hypothetical protein PR048_009532 [Dryococelus australis]|uniref:Uncharacterized protein n=1 Tax=Dryococelus australis TaxID=614101 RepID=A0ABQ9I048_9NEOP|nr:hypothetical protein PR048_009532 [Dryococelus australis]
MKNATQVRTGESTMRQGEQRTLSFHSDGPWRWRREERLDPYDVTSTLGNDWPPAVMAEKVDANEGRLPDPQFMSSSVIRPNLDPTPRWTHLARHTTCQLVSCQGPLTTPAGGGGAERHDTE